MPNGRGQGRGKSAGKGPDKAPGQQKPFKIVNPETGEEREITVAEWRTQGRALRAEGFVSVEDEEEEVEEPEEPETDEPA